MKELLKKYQKEIQELMRYKAKLADEYARTAREETKETFYKTQGKITKLLEVIEDLKQLEKGDD